MSTPKTDAACGWPWGYHGRIESSDLKLSPDGPFVHSSVARELERENAALRSTLTLIRSTTDESWLTQAQIIETVGNYCDEVLGVEART